MVEIAEMWKSSTVNKLLLLHVMRLAMDRAISLQFVLTAILVVLYPKAEGQWHIHPPVTPVLCASQFALVNSACAMLPFTPVPPPSPPTPPSPTPPSPGGPDSRHGHSHSHGHRHSHHHSHRHKETPAEGDCCRWVKQVDTVCVCDLLVLLPPFLTRPVHNYTVVVDETCNVTFQCGSRLVR